MLSIYKIWKNQGKQYIPDVAKINLPSTFRGMPAIDAAPCAEGCNLCAELCPTQAIQLDPLRLDLGKCTFCGECALACPDKKIRFTPNYFTATNDRDMLMVQAETGERLYLNPDKVRKEIQSYFGGSLKLRQVSAGGCNACENELNAGGNVNFDMGRWGIEFLASPRHCDGVVISGVVTENMAETLELCYEAIPNPKIVIAAGACAISGGIFAESPALERRFFDQHSVDLYVPGCPPHPLTFVNGVLELIRYRNK